MAEKVESEDAALYERIKLFMQDAEEIVSQIPSGEIQDGLRMWLKGYIVGMLERRVSQALASRGLPLLETIDADDHAAHSPSRS